MAKALSVSWDERADPAANARRALPRLAAEYFAFVRGFLRKNPAPDRLHALRLATKRLRYTLELFRPCYGPGMETRLAALRVIQQLLGDVNDSVAAARELPKAARARVFLADRAASKAAEFRKHWMETFDAPGQEDVWVRYLARNARRPARPSPPSR